MSVRRLAVTVVLVNFGLAGCGESPESSRFHPYKIAVVLSSARELQNMGREASVAQLREWAKSSDREFKVIVLCRMLFKGKGTELRPPLLGSPLLLGDTTYKDWPLSPITIFEGLPVLIAHGYLLMGVPESATSYLDYCVKNGEWETTAYIAKTPEEIRSSIGRLVKDAKWRRELRDTEVDFLRSQAPREPTE